MIRVMAAEENSSLATRPSLLNRLKAGDDTQGWQDFYRLYGPLIRNFARKAGLTEDEAEEVVQETAVSVARNLPGYTYDPKVCAFKTWLLNLTQWRVTDQLRKRRSSERIAGEPAGKVRRAGCAVCRRDGAYGDGGACAGPGIARVRRRVGCGLRAASF